MAFLRPTLGAMWAKKTFLNAKEKHEKQKRRLKTEAPVFNLERVKGVEPSSLAWKARVIAVIRHPLSKKGENANRFLPSLMLAEKGGFEPPRPLFRPAPLAGVCIRPLCHFSAGILPMFCRGRSSAHWDTCQTNLVSDQGYLCPSSIRETKHSMN